MKGKWQMASVTRRIDEIKQPRGGYIKPSEFQVTVMDDGIILNEEENISGSIFGMAVDCLTRFNMGADIAEAFKISLRGATIAESFGVKRSLDVAKELLKGIKVVEKEVICYE